MTPVTINGIVLTEGVQKELLRLQRTPPCCALEYIEDIIDVLIGVNQDPDPVTILDMVATMREVSKTLRALSDTAEEESINVLNLNSDETR